MTTQGLILVDVDGPLNAWRMKPTRKPRGHVVHRFRPTGWETALKPLRVVLNPEHGPMLLDLAAATGWELVWASTWEADANRMIGPAIGLPELPFITFGAQPAALREWKFGAVAAYADGRPLVWFDDDFNVPGHHSALAMFQLRRETTPTLLRYVSPRVGLTSDDLRVVREWIVDRGSSR